jgi:hypothetical protein
MFVVGILPNLILKPTDASVSATLAQAEERKVVLMDEAGARAWLDGSQ